MFVNPDVVYEVDGEDLIRLYHGDCLNVMSTIATGSIDMILADLPYGTTACKWDTVIPFKPLWKQYKRIAKPRGAIVLHGSQPFTSILIKSNIKWFKYRWIWDKVNRISNHLNAKIQPLRVAEEICIFSSGTPMYNPQMIEGKPYVAVSRGRKTSCYGEQSDGVKTVNEGWYYPTDIIAIPGDERGSVGRIHPTQKPIPLLEYLIKTYTNEGETVLDNTMGSGSTGVACVNTGRNFIGIELYPLPGPIHKKNNPNYFDIADERIGAMFDG